MTFSALGSVGTSARGIWEAMSCAAPTFVSTWTLPGDATPNSRRAVPSGMMTEFSRPLWRSTLARIPMTV